ncbi:hypothetical protein ACOME3_009229 [Neoechinorhynchus agilis]
MTSIPKSLYMNAICIDCMHCYSLCCQYCQNYWEPAMIIIGTLYHYDIICAQPCCNNWQLCDHCKRWALKETNDQDDPIPLPFSHVDNEFSCVHCGTRSRHCLKPFHSMLRITNNEKHSLAE